MVDVGEAEVKTPAESCRILSEILPRQLRQRASPLRIEDRPRVFNEDRLLDGSIPVQGRLVLGAV